MRCCCSWTSPTSTWGKAPSAVRLTDLEPALILAFLNDLEQQRGNSYAAATSASPRCGAFLKFAAHRDVTALQTIEQALGVPMKRFDRPPARLSHPRRDAGGDRRARCHLGGAARPPAVHAALQHRRAVSEILVCGSPMSSWTPHPACTCTARDASSARSRSGPPRSMRSELGYARNPALRADAPLLPNRDGRPMTRQNVNQRLAIAVARAAVDHPTLAKRHVSPHCIRHTTAMHMLAVRRGLQCHRPVAGPRNPRPPRIATSRPTCHEGGRRSRGSRSPAEPSPATDHRTSCDSSSRPCNYVAEGADFDPSKQRSRPSSFTSVPDCT